MNILTVYAHPNPKSFCHAILQQFTKGLEDAGHTSEVVDLYAIRFDPVFRMRDFASYVHESIPVELLEQMDLKQEVLDYLYDLTYERQDRRLLHHPVAIFSLPPHKD